MFSFSPEVSSSMTLSEKLSDIFNTAVIGFAVVFTVLGLIWIILELFGKIFAQKSDPVAEAPTAVAEAAEASVLENQSNYDDDGNETVAAIMAAISAYSNKPISSFRVVSFKRTNNK